MRLYYLKQLVRMRFFVYILLLVESSQYFSSVNGENLVDSMLSSAANSNNNNHHKSHNHNHHLNHAQNRNHDRVKKNNNNNGRKQTHHNKRQKTTTSTTTVPPSVDLSEEQPLPPANVKSSEVDSQSLAAKSDMRNVDYIANITAKVGESVILYCAINSSYDLNPGVIWMQGNLGHVLTLNKNRITVDSRFEIVQDLTNIEVPAGSVIIKNAHANYHAHPHGPNKMLRHNQPQTQPQQQLPNGLTFYHLKINNLQTFDENEYACETTFENRDDEETPNLKSVINLQVTQSPSFIETLTSESNLIALENGNAILKCFAVGKPTPKIRWYKIEEETGMIRGNFSLMMIF